jgi:glyoxylase-like metal-dependent hydrolase (beta-lactamase superfamily II)/rhodanese-related sulfurtransferase
MILKQYYLGCLAHASYLIADEQTKLAAVVDPQRDVEHYLQDAAEAGYTIKYVFLTHFHADFLAGHIELRNRAGAEIVMGARAEAEFDFRRSRTGDRIELGDVRIETLETPGHTPEGISLLVYAHADDTEPHAVLTGDTLFIGDVGRPDLLASIGVTADELAEMLYHSLDQLRGLPDATLVYPAHGAGSMCGKQLSKETVSTIGEQKRFNYALQPMGLEQFKRLVTSEQPEAPDYFVYDAIKNRQERPDLATTLDASLRPLPVDEVVSLRDQGAQLVDVREAADFEGAHFAGAINIGLKGKYATWCGSILSHETPIVVIAEPGSEEEAVMRLGRIGFDNVAGYLAGGMAALASHPDLIRSVSRITAAALAELQDTQPAPWVLDVRSEKEWAGGYLPGSHNLPLTHLQDRLAEVPADRPVVVHCEGGYRSAIAASLLAAAGRTNVLDLVGGYKAWNASQLPTLNETGTAACGEDCAR